MRAIDTDSQTDHTDALKALGATCCCIYLHVNLKKHSNMKRQTTTTLSSREREILEYISLGYTSKEIASLFYLSVHTVISHKKNLVLKLSAKNQAHLIRVAMENQLINLNSRIAITA